MIGRPEFRAGATVVLSSVPLDLVLVEQRSLVLVVAALLAQVVLVLGSDWLLLRRERQRQLATGLFLRQSGSDEVRIEFGADGRIVVQTASSMSAEVPRSDAT